MTCLYAPCHLDVLLSCSGDFYFVFMYLQSNENMELMTSLQTEQHACKELATRLGQQEDELKDLREQVSVT